MHIIKAVKLAHLVPRPIFIKKYVGTYLQLLFTERELYVANIYNSEDLVQITLPQFGAVAPPCLKDAVISHNDQYVALIYQNGHIDILDLKKQKSIKTIFGMYNLKEIYFTANNKELIIKLSHSPLKICIDMQTFETKRKIFLHVTQTDFLRILPTIME